MQYSASAIAGLLLTQALASPHQHLHRRQTTTACSTGVHVIVGAPASYPAQLGLLQTLINGIQSNMPGSDYTITPYDQSAIPARDAVPVMEQEIADYAASCPNTPIALIGYSRGGIVIMNVLCSGTVLPSNVIAATSYGEETYLGGQSYDVGTCTVNAPSYARNTTVGCSKYAPILKSWCNSADNACCATGTSSDAHFTYASQYDAVAVSWIRSKYDIWHAAHLPKSSSTSSSKPFSTVINGQSSSSSSSRPFSTIVSSSSASSSKPSSTVVMSSTSSPSSSKPCSSTPKSLSTLVTSTKTPCSTTPKASSTTTKAPCSTPVKASSTTSSKQPCTTNNDHNSWGHGSSGWGDHDHDHNSWGHGSSGWGDNNDHDHDSGSHPSTSNPGPKPEWNGSWSTWFSWLEQCKDWQAKWDAWWNSQRH